jgi:glutathione S-transferase
MTIRMYDLAGANPAVRFSPYCWRIRMALAHKGLDVETIAWRFTDKSAISFSGQGAVPVIRDGEKVLNDSWAIAEYLDEHYPSRPKLFDGAQGKALANFARHYAQSAIAPIAFKAVILDIFAAVDARDRDYFRQSREARFGKTLEAFATSEEEAAAQMRIALAPLRALIAEQPFVNGEAPAFADYCIFGTFMWIRNVSPKALVAKDDAVQGWLERMLDLFGGLARKSPRASD